MSCNDDVLAMLEGIKNALIDLVNEECCPTPAQPGGGGSRGAGTTRQPPNTFESDGENFPEDQGWDTREEWKNYECNAAWDLINNLTQDLLGLSGITIALTTGITGWVAVLIGVLVTPIPFDDLAALAALLITSSLLYGLMAELSVIIGDNRDNLVCILYNAENATEAQQDLVGELNGLVNDNFSDPGASFLLHVIDYMVTFDSVNKLFVGGVTVKQDADCSECEEPPAGTYTVVIGSEDSEPAGAANPIVVTTVNDVESSGQCGADGREMVITFDEQVDISSVVVAGDFCGVCGGLPLFFAYEVFPATGEVYIGNALPQIDGTWLNVGVIYFYFNCDGNTPVVTIDYTVSAP
jgi:hypothetical protein